MWPSLKKPDAPPSRELLDAILARLDTIEERLPLVVDTYDDTELRDGLDHLLTLVAAELEDMKLAISHGIEHVDRAERRVNQTVSRARKELAKADLEYPALESEHQELQLLDGGRSEGVQPVPEDVAAPESRSFAEANPGIPGELPGDGEIPWDSVI